jgi:flagellar motor switch protein FliG
LILTCLAWPLCGFTQAQLASTQQQVESEIRGFLAEQLRPGEYFVYALVTAPEEASNEASSTENPEGVLPYGALKIPGSYLKEILEKNLPAEDVNKLKVDVTLGLDDRLPEDKRKIVEDVVRKRFGFDGAQRSLSVQALKLVTSPIAENERFELEKTKMESTQARLELETERAKLATQQKELELTRVTTEAATAAQKAQVEKAALVAQQAQVAAGQAPAAADLDPKSMQASLQMNPSIALFKDFQLTAMALVLGIVLVVAIVVGGSFFIKGLSPLSTAIEAVGSSIETAAKTSGSSQTSVTAALSAGSGGGGGGDLANGSDDRPGGGAVGHGGAVSEAQAEANEEFIKQVQDKVEILCKEKRFGLFRVLSDMIESRQSLPQAAAVLVTLEAEVARAIIQELPIEQIGKLKNFLSQEGGLAKARDLRFQALSEFYGRIAVEEFTDSPLMELKDLSWLTKMSTGEIARLINSLSDQERPVFLACLSPERVKKILEGANSSDKEVIIKSLAVVDTVTHESIKPVIDGISSRMSKGTKSSTTQRFAVDGAKYIAAVASELSDAEQAKLFDVIGGKANLVESVREHYIPFNMLTSLPKELVLEIFSDRPDAQIAQIIFDSKDDVRSTVINAFPDIRAESVKDELRVLDSDKFYDKRNRKMSLRLQKEISRYLLRLHSEGLLAFNKVGEIKEGEDRGGNHNAA